MSQQSNWPKRGVDAERAAKKSCVPFSIVVAAVMSGQAAYSDPPKEKYVFVENTDSWVGVVRGELYLIGKLDKNGDFIQEMKFETLQPLTLAPIHKIINSSGSTTKPKKVYEYRSGMLIPRALHPDGRFAAGRFVPEAGGKIIAFNEYEYSPTATPIWNLPGLFLTEKEAAELKKAKPADKK